VTRWLYRILVVLLVVGLVGAGALVWQNEAGAGAAGSGDDSVATGTATPVLSVRRVPSALAAPVAERRLARSLDALAATLPADTCIAVQGPDVGYGHRATSPVVPASTQKLVTATAALDAVGGDTRLRTAVVAPAPPAGGVVAGDLTLIGGGDPLLATPDYVARFPRQPQRFTDLGALAQSVVAAGVRRVEGSVVGDERRYDTARSVAGWPQRYLDQRQAGPLSALALNDGFEQYPTPDAPDAPVEPAAQPAQAAAARLTALLEAAGVEVVGEPGAGAAPAGAVEVAGVDSAPLNDIVAQLLEESDNNTAELLLKEVGHDAGDATTPGGAAAATAVLGDGSVDATGVRVADGSGLSVDNRVTCDLLVDLLAREGTGPAVQDRLAVAGESGTLEGRYEGTPLAGTLRGKTGSLNTVRSLAGVVEDDDPPLLFALVVNVPEGQAMPAGAVAAQQAVGEALLAWPQVPDASALGPRDGG